MLKINETYFHISWIIMQIYLVNFTQLLNYFYFFFWDILGCKIATFSNRRRGGGLQSVLLTAKTDWVLFMLQNLHFENVHRVVDENDSNNRKYIRQWNGLDINLTWGSSGKFFQKIRNANIWREKNYRRTWNFANFNYMLDLSINFKNSSILIFRMLLPENICPYRVF